MQTQTTKTVISFNDRLLLL